MNGLKNMSGTKSFIFKTIMIISVLYCCFGASTISKAGNIGFDATLKENIKLNLYMNTKKYFRSRNETGFDFEQIISFLNYKLENMRICIFLLY